MSTATLLWIIMKVQIYPWTCNYAFVFFYGTAIKCFRFMIAEEYFSNIGRLHTVSSSSELLEKQMTVNKRSEESAQRCMHVLSPPLDFAFPLCCVFRRAGKVAQPRVL